jgi:hypothetical protein
LFRKAAEIRNYLAHNLLKHYSIETKITKYVIYINKKKYTKCTNKAKLRKTLDITRYAKIKQLKNVEKTFLGRLV